MQENDLSISIQTMLGGSGALWHLSSIIESRDLCATERHWAAQESKTATEVGRYPCD